MKKSHGTKWAVIFRYIILSLVMFFLLGSLLICSQKRNTCSSITDVWKDVEHLISQKDGHRTDSSHIRHALRLYFFSNLLDGPLCEWRYLEQQQLLPQVPDIIYLSWDTIDGSADTVFSSATFCVPVLLRISSVETTFHNNPNTLDYTHEVNTVEVEGYAVYSKNDNTFFWDGYSSKLVFSSYVTEAETETQKSREIMCGTSFSDIEMGDFSSLSYEDALVAKKGSSCFFDAGVLQHQ